MVGCILIWDFFGWKNKWFLSIFQLYFVVLFGSKPEKFKFIYIEGGFLILDEWFFFMKMSVPNMYQVIALKIELIFFFEKNKIFIWFFIMRIISKILPTIFGRSYFGITIALTYIHTLFYIEPSWTILKQCKISE